VHEQRMSQYSSGAMRKTDPLLVRSRQSWFANEHHLADEEPGSCDAQLEGGKLATRNFVSWSVFSSREYWYAKSCYRRSAQNIPWNSWAFSNAFVRCFKAQSKKNVQKH